LWHSFFHSAYRFPQKNCHFRRFKMTVLKLDKVATGLGFPEGPVAMADGSLLFVDIQKQNLSRLTARGQVEIVASLPGGPNGLAIGPDGAAYVCNNGGIYDFGPVPIAPGVTVTLPSPVPSKNYTFGKIQRVDLKTGAVSLLYDSCNGEHLLTPDDLVFDQYGGFWFTDTGIQDAGSIRKGGLYYATIDGKSIKRVGTIPSANGVGLSPDGQVLYVSDTLFGRLWSLTISDPQKDPSAVNPPKFPFAPADIVQTLPGLQWVDSLRVEAGGKVCVGTLINGGITIFDPKNGTTERFDVPDLMTTNLAFGGDDMQDVWITASSTGSIYRTRWPRPGLKLAFCA
jgi:gluconolactonase